jgi:hypothetical protein
MEEDTDEPWVQVWILLKLKDVIDTALVKRRDIVDTAEPKLNSDVETSCRK